jgi:hypothetical protein
MPWNFCFICRFSSFLSIENSIYAQRWKMETIEIIDGKCWATPTYRYYGTQLHICGFSVAPSRARHTLFYWCFRKTSPIFPVFGKKWLESNPDFVAATVCIYMYSIFSGSGTRQLYDSLSLTFYKCHVYFPNTAVIDAPLLLSLHPAAMYCIIV